ncbi:MAG: DUF4115 domain-containing protein [Alphaproteobacteria bacterium]|nr:DUF4115 domain-containing protein [Alphaproteobacteria bacterium]
MKTTHSDTAVQKASQESGARATVGALLRETRENAGETVLDAARALRISQKYIEAIEDGRHADLPGAAYAIGFVRSYADHLRLDSDEIVRRYKSEADGLDPRKDLYFPNPISEGGVPGAAIIGLGLVAAGLAYGLWYWQFNQDGVETARVDAVPEHMTAEPTAPERPAASDAANADASAQGVPNGEPRPTLDPGLREATLDPGAGEQAEQTAAAAAAAETVPDGASEPASADTETAPPPPTQLGEPMAPAADAAQAEPTPPSASVPEAPLGAVEAPSESLSPAPIAAPDPGPTLTETPSRITIRAKANSWIQVRDVKADRLMFTRLLRKGDEYQAPDMADLVMMTGNAGALEIEVDGKAIPPIGEMGEVMRNVKLSPDALRTRGD